MVLRRVPLLRHRDEWLKILAYIGAKRTHEPAFKILFKKVLDGSGHPYHQEATLLKEWYDFTPVPASKRDLTAGDRKYKK